MDPRRNPPAIQRREGPRALRPGDQVVFGPVDQERRRAVAPAQDLREGADACDFVGGRLGEQGGGGGGGGGLVIMVWEAVEEDGESLSGPVHV